MRITDKDNTVRRFPKRTIETSINDLFTWIGWAYVKNIVRASSEDSYPGIYEWLERDNFDLDESVSGIIVAIDQIESRMASLDEEYGREAFFKYLDEVDQHYSIPGLEHAARIKKREREAWLGTHD